MVPNRSTIAEDPSFVQLGPPGPARFAGDTADRSARVTRLPATARPRASSPLRRNERQRDPTCGPYETPRQGAAGETWGRARRARTPSPHAEAAPRCRAPSPARRARTSGARQAPAGGGEKWASGGRSGSESGPA